MVRTRRSVNGEKARVEQYCVPNPMLENVILELIFEIMPFCCSDFKNFRLVCKQWTTASFPRWRRNAWINIRDSRFLPDHSYLHIPTCVEMITSPGDPFGFLGPNHFRRYNVRLAHNMTWMYHSFYGKGRFEFWSILGPLMTHLRVTKSKISSCEQVKSVLLEMTPQLEYFSYESNDIVEASYVPFPLTHIEWYQTTEPVWSNLMIPPAAAIQNKLTCLEVRLNQDFPISWVYYLARFPNITILKLAEFVDTYRVGSLYEELPMFFKSLRRIRERCNPECMRNLQKLDILNAGLHPLREFPATLLPLLRDLAFPLAELALDIGVDQGEQRLTMILLMYSNTLRKVAVFRGPYASPFLETFPFGVKLPQLTELKLVGPICPNLIFLKNTPHLKVLMLLDGTREIEDRVLRSYMDFSLPTIRDEAFLNRIPLPAQPVISSTDFSNVELRNLVLPGMEELVFGHELCSGVQVKRLGKIFPNLKKLRLGLDDTGFAEVCRIWTETLKHLDVEPFDVGEAGLLGTVNGQMYSQPNLTDFTHLAFLRMGWHSRTMDAARLSNNSILHGLFAADCLKEVYFSVYPKDHKKIRARLISKFPQT